MKKKLRSMITMVLSLCMLGGFTAGAQGMDSYEADALETAQALRDEEYQTVYDRLNETMKAAISSEQLAAGCQQIAQAFGDFVAVESVTSTVTDGLTTVEVVERYQLGGVKVIITYSTLSEIAGLRLSPAALAQEAQSTDQWEEIPLTVAAQSELPLNAMLTLPVGVEKPPVVIFVHGSGSSDMNESVGTAGNGPFRDIAHGLAEQGIASLRYDKRSYVYPETFGDLSTVTLEQETLDDAYAAIAMMEADERVDGVFVLGHSLGGMLVPKIVTDHPELKGAISMAGTLRQLWDVIYDQSMEALAALGEVPEEQKAAVDAQLAKLEADVAVLRDGSYQSMADTELLMNIPVGYWRSLDNTNGMRFLDSLTAPLLILQGEADFQVYADVDYELWKECLGDRDNVTFRLYEGLNHLMMPTTGLRTVEDYNTAATVSPEVINDIGAFVMGR
ncbi:MAG: alpha/beta hydrolase [Eubacteriales bacterium]|nr:alpha/beta hydrolase [Eubacteriales bacterium]